MPKVFTAIESDTEIVLRASMDLTGSTVVARIRPEGSTTTPAVLTCAVVDAAAGWFSVPLAAVTAGRYDLQVKVTQAGGKIANFPGTDFDTLVVDTKLG